ncbi:ARM-REPEAT/TETRATRICOPEPTIDE REPEAT (TPR)-LIKE PROTEIN [Salix purpurea]|uniref:ARM-REPEAT/TETRATRICOPEPTIDE REPEAT (TPR)-LIKE PROTEIN n=1 Tax=Salix purpurea TaxID=77065 RepID=A0A9Q0PD56_SALPP|nr:ARM-REPEAT/TETRATRICOPEPTIDE REPEAT (TPR)-LIKE PROTEIN [Salix purpurea]
MDSLKKKEKIIHTIATTSSNESIIDINTEQSCINPSCFFCTMKEPNSMIRRAGLQRCFKEMPSRDNQALVLVLSGLWNIAMTQPDDPEFPSLGVFRCMASLIQKGIDNKSWLLKDQNIYIPYYAAHIIGSYTMNKAKFAEKAVQSGVIPPLMDLLRGKMSWVEQRVAVRALSHLASYEKTFDAVAMYEEDVVKSAMKLASNCLEVVYTKFVGVPDAKERLEYHRDLLTRGVGGLDTENRKAEEWACQLQRWSLYLLNCFACKESKHGRKSIAESKEVVIRLCHISRSSDDWQYIGIDCLLLLLKDQDTRFKVLEISALFLVDLVELRSLADRSNVGEEIARVLLFDYRQIMLKLKSKEVQKVMQEIWDLKVERRKQEKTMPKEMVEERRVLVGLIKQQGNHMFCLGDIEEALAKYTEALDLCPLRLRKERVVLYSDRAQCRLLLGDPDAAISDLTRALCLSTPANSHSKSLWRRSQAFDRKRLAKESLMDCVMFLNSCVKTETAKGVKIPYHAARMISKQMEATWIFASLESKASSNQSSKVQESKNYDKQKYDEMMRIMIEKKGLISRLSTIREEPFIGNEEVKRKMERARSKKDFSARSMQGRWGSRIGAC